MSETWTQTRGVVSRRRCLFVEVGWRKRSMLGRDVCIFYNVHFFQKTSSSFSYGLLFDNIWILSNDMIYDIFLELDFWHDDIGFSAHSSRSMNYQRADVWCRFLDSFHFFSRIHSFFDNLFFQTTLLQTPKTGKSQKKDWT